MLKRVPTGRPLRINRIHPVDPPPNYLRRAPAGDLAQVQERITHLEAAKAAAEEATAALRAELVAGSLEAAASAQQAQQETERAASERDAAQQQLLEAQDSVASLQAQLRQQADEAWAAAAQKAEELAGEANTLNARLAEAERALAAKDSELQQLTNRWVALVLPWMGGMQYGWAAQPTVAACFSITMDKGSCPPRIQRGMSVACTR